MEGECLDSATNTITTESECLTNPLITEGECLPNPLTMEGECLDSATNTITTESECLSATNPITMEDETSMPDGTPESGADEEQIDKDV